MIRSAFIAPTGNSIRVNVWLICEVLWRYHKWDQIITGSQLIGDRKGNQSFKADCVIDTEVFCSFGDASGKIFADLVIMDMGAQFCWHFITAVPKYFKKLFEISGCSLSKTHWKVKIKIDWVTPDSNTIDTLTAIMILDIVFRRKMGCT